MLDILAFEHFTGVAEFDLCALRTPGSDRCDFVTRELALGEDLHHFAPDISGRSDDGYAIAQITYS
jgi:hypothetical protein